MQDLFRLTMTSVALKCKEQHLWLWLVVLLSGVFPISVVQTPPQFISSHTGASSGLTFCIGEVGDAYREFGQFWYSWYLVAGCLSPPLVLLLRVWDVTQGVILPGFVKKMVKMKLDKHGDMNTWEHILYVEYCKKLTLAGPESMLVNIYCAFFLVLFWPLQSQQCGQNWWNRCLTLLCSVKKTDLRSLMLFPNTCYLLWCDTSQTRITR